MQRWIFRWGAALMLAMTFVPVAMAADAMVVYRDPSCGCCGAWIAYARAHGYTVTVHEDQPMNAVKTREGIPAALASCHTAKIDGYVIEGHVPVEDIRRLLAERPDARGLAVPGMPMGSPGMEMGVPERYDVLLIEHDGTTRVYATHGPGFARSHDGVGSPARFEASLAGAGGLRCRLIDLRQATSPCICATLTTA